MIGGTSTPGSYVTLCVIQCLLINLSFGLTQRVFLFLVKILSKTI